MSFLIAPSFRARRDHLVTEVCAGCWCQPAKAVWLQVPPTRLKTKTTCVFPLTGNLLKLLYSSRVDLWRNSGLLLLRSSVLEIISRCACEDL